MKNIKEQIAGIAKDLLNLEINTIIKANITGGKMPSPRHTLIDIAKEYSVKLTNLRLPLQDQTVKLGSYKSFDLLRERANEGIKAFRERAATKGLTTEEEANLLMLHRIQDMSDQIKGMFNALKSRKVEKWENDFTHEEIEQDRPPFPLTLDELVLLRKVWEVGVEEITMQTVIQLDGDVVTRVQPRHVKGQSESLYEIHSQSVSVSIRSWKELIGVVKDFFETIFKMFR